MCSRSVLEPISPRIMSSPELFLVMGEAAPAPDDIVIKAGVRDPVRDSEYGCRYRDEAGSGRTCNDADDKIQDKLDNPSEDYLETRSLLRGNIVPEISEDDGFRTPVSAENRIAAVAECPPAPKKPKPVPWRKRKFPPSDGRSDNGIGSLIIHLSDEEVEAMFPPIVPPESCNKIKRARRDDGDRE